MEIIQCPNIMDIEASGFGHASYPIEIGIAKANGERYCSLITPDDAWEFWSHEAESLHGIKRDLLFAKGQSTVKVCQELNHFLDGEDVFCDAIAHDQHWLNQLFHNAKMYPNFKLRAIEFIMHEQQLLSWDKTKESIALQLDIRRHRASSDAFLIQQTFVQSAKQVA